MFSFWPILGSIQRSGGGGGGFFGAGGFEQSQQKKRTVHRETIHEEDQASNQQGAVAGGGGYGGHSQSGLYQFFQSHHTFVGVIITENIIFKFKKMGTRFFEKNSLHLSRDGLLPSFCQIVFFNLWNLSNWKFR